MGLPFIGSEAVAAGVLTRGQLRWNYTTVFPDVYLPKDDRRHLYHRAYAAWLWPKRTGIISGRTAAALFCLDVLDDAPVEMISTRRQSPPGIVVRRQHIEDDELAGIGGLT